MSSISKKYLTQTRAGLLFVLYVLIGGCVAVPAPVPAPVPVPDPAPQFPPTVYVDSAITKSRMFGFVVNEAVGVSGLLEVEASFQNKGQGPYDFVYRFIWLDKNNFTVKTRLSNWKSIKLTEKGFATLHGIAPSERVARYRLEIYSQDTIFKTNSEVKSDNSK